MISDWEISSEMSGPTSGSRRSSLRRYLATSPAPSARMVRRVRRAVQRLSIPAPRGITKPLLWLYLAGRAVSGFCLRVFVSEPLFKASCTRYGKHLRTDRHIHWISGKGEIVVGDDVWLDGKINVTFAARFADRPRLEIGDKSQVGNLCEFRIGKSISIGRNCNLSGQTIVMDSNGHPADPRTRWAGEGPTPEDVRPVIIRDGVWIGLRCMIFPGVRIGEGSIVSAGSVVRTHVPPYSVVAGNPARVIFRLKKPADAAGVTPRREV